MDDFGGPCGAPCPVAGMAAGWDSGSAPGAHSRETGGRSPLGQGACLLTFKVAVVPLLVRKLTAGFTVYK